MPDQVEPDDVPVELQSATVSDVLDAVESLQLTVDSLMRLIRNLVLSAALIMLGMMLADLIFP